MMEFYWRAARTTEQIDQEGATESICTFLYVTDFKHESKMETLKPFKYVVGKAKSFQREK